jgi:hypothetical protein
VILSFPQDEDLSVIARFVAAAVASRANFDIDEVEDVCVAVGELLRVLCHRRSGGYQLVEFVHGDDRVEVSGEYVPGLPADRQAGATEDDLSRAILGALVDEHGTDERHGRPRVWFTKRREGRSVRS